MEGAARAFPVADAYLGRGPRARLGREGHEHAAGRFDDVLAAGRDLDGLVAEAASVKLESAHRVVVEAKHDKAGVGRLGVVMGLDHPGRLGAEAARREPGIDLALGDFEGEAGEMDNLGFLLLELLQVGVGIDRVDKHIGVAEAGEVADELDGGQAAVEAQGAAADARQVEGLAEVLEGQHRAQRDFGVVHLPALGLLLDVEHAAVLEVVRQLQVLVTGLARELDAQSPASVSDEAEGAGQVLDELVKRVDGILERACLGQVLVRDSGALGRDILGRRALRLHVNTLGVLNHHFRRIENDKRKL